MAKLAAEDLRGYLTRPTFVARLIQQMKNKIKFEENARRRREEEGGPSVR